MAGFYTLGRHTPVWLQLVAYTMKTKSREFVDADIQDVYIEAKATADVRAQLTAYLRILVKVISESGERDHIPRKRTLEGVVLV